VSLLLLLVALVCWHRATFDSWLLRYDVATQFVPWYHFLGQNVRALEIPAWNPHYLSGTPFAGHPLSGWMYFPAMVSFALFPVLAGFKAMLALHLVIAALTTYGLARVLGLGAIASLTAAIVFSCGPLLEWNTYTSLQFAQFAVWVPAVLLGIELAARTPDWRRRLAPWVLAAFGFSQMLAGWIGEGWMYALLLTGGYIGYRFFPRLPWTVQQASTRLRQGAITGAVVIGGGTALGAAGILPRLATNAESALAGGYGELGASGTLNEPWSVTYLATQVLGMGDGYHFRAAGLGGAVVVLALFGVFFGKDRYGVPYFAIVTLVSLIMTLDATPLHRLAYLIPRYQELHEHDPWRVVALGCLGPAMLSGAGVEMLGRLQGRYRLLPVTTIPLVMIVGLVLAVGPFEGMSMWGPLLGATLVTAIALIVVDLPPSRTLRSGWRGVSGAVLALTCVVVFLLPTGLELTGSWLGWPNDARWARRWEPNPAHEAALEVYADPNDGGATAFLQQQFAASGPFRFLGYGGVGHPDGGPHARSYMDRRFDPHILGILANGRSMVVELNGVQGYDPIQLQRYVDFVRAVNQKGQDYHTAFVSDEGVASPLLDLLDVRFLLIDASLPLDRPDIVTMTDGFEEVYRDEFVVVYEHGGDLPHAWIVHDVQQVESGAALPLIVDGEIDPYRTALVEGPVPSVRPAVDPAADRADIRHFGAEAISIDTQTDAPGFLIISEVYATGWNATVNGVPVDVVPTHHALRGVPIPAGESTVELRYEPLPLTAGLWISGGALMVMTGMLAVAWWTRADRARPGLVVFRATLPTRRRNP
jgi:hypothetical protein